jgi:hypothetical protein
MAPNRDEYLQTQAPQPLEPGAFGQSPQQPRGDVLVPASYAGELMALAAAKERGKHDPDDFAQELLLRLQSAFDLSHQGIRETQVLQGLMDGLDIALGLGALLSETLLDVETTTFVGFDLFLGVSFHRGHGDLLRGSLFLLHSRRKPCPI